jgi:hypothetical protein
VMRSREGNSRDPRLVNPIRVIRAIRLRASRSGGQVRLS